MKTHLTDNDSNERAVRALNRMAKEFKPSIKEGLLACAERVSVIARGKYLRGPRPGRLRSRVGKSTGYMGDRVKGGGRLEKSLIIQGGGYEGLAVGRGGRGLILKFTLSAGDQVGLDYGTKVPYAAIWEFGPQTRIIRPKTKKWLTFRLENGQWVRTKEVRQTPGRRAFLAPALKDASPEFGDIIGEKLQVVLDRYGEN